MKVLYVFGDNITTPRGTPRRAKSILQSLIDENIDVDYLGFNDKKDLPVGVGEVFFLKKSRSDNKKDLSEVLREKKYDVIFASTINTAWYVYSLSRSIDVPIVVDIHSFKSDEQKPSVKKYVNFIRERVGMILADGIVSVNSGVDRVAKTYCSQRVIIEGGCDTQFFSPRVDKDSRIVALKEKKHASGVVMYAGNFRTYQGTDYLFDAALTIGRKDILFVFVGNTADIPAEKKKVLDECPHIHFVGQVDGSEMPSLLNSADILVIPRTTDRVNYYAFPSKLTEYMSMAKGVISTDVGDIGRLITEDTGIMVKPNDVESLREGILTLIKDKELLDSIGRQSRKLVEEKYTWKAMGMKLSGFLRGF